MSYTHCPKLGVAGSQLLSAYLNPTSYIKTYCCWTFTPILPTQDITVSSCNSDLVRSCTHRLNVRFLHTCKIFIIRLLIRISPYRPTFLQDECPSKATLEEIHSSGDTRSAHWSMGNQKIQVSELSLLYIFDFLFEGLNGSTVNGMILFVEEVGVHLLAGLSIRICSSVIHPYVSFLHDLLNSS